MNRPASLRQVDDRTLPLAIGIAGPVVVIFTASWCPPCRRAESEAAALAKTIAGVPVMLAELDESQGMALAANVQGVPTLALYRDGGLAGVRLGAASAGQWAEWISGVINPAKVAA